MDACTKCKKPTSLIDLRAAPGGRAAEALCPSCYARWAEFQLEAFAEEVHAVHAAAHARDEESETPPGEQLAGCRWDACKRAARLAQARVLA